MERLVGNIAVLGADIGNKDGIDTVETHEAGADPPLHEQVIKS